MEVCHRIRDGLFQCLQLHEHGVGAFVPDGAVLGPAAEELGKREGIDIIALGAVVIMRDGVGLDGAGARRHGVPRECAGARGRESLLGMLHARRTQEAVNLRGADLQEFFPKSFGQRRS